MKIMTVAGARPNFMKVAPLITAMRAYPDIVSLLVHTGQHYDDNMSRQFFEDLELPKPDLDLEVGSASHAVQTAKIMMAFEEAAIRHRPDLVIVVGDVNSTIACALATVKLHIPVAHVEAGLRSFDRTMPEEINRVLTDALADELFVSERSGVENLLKEGIPEAKIHFVGNVMIDTLLANKAKAERSSILQELDIQPRTYALLTLHRPSNVDDDATLAGIVKALTELRTMLPVIFPIHPRTRKHLESAGFAQTLSALPNVRLLDPLGYLDFLKLLAEARLVLTDSGGIQEETTILNVPCLTLRENTERPVTVRQGTNTIVGMNPANILEVSRQVLSSPIKPARQPELWDGQAAQRIIAMLHNKYEPLVAARQKVGDMV